MFYIILHNEIQNIEKMLAHYISYNHCHFKNQFTFLVSVQKQEPKVFSRGMGSVILYIKLYISAFEEPLVMHSVKHQLNI